MGLLPISDELVRHVAVREGVCVRPLLRRVTGEGEDAGTGQRRTRSTRRLQGMPDLPQRPREDRTVGTVFTVPDGKRFQPSMFVTLTLDSYGKVRTADLRVWLPG